jgi:hypothetical protein
MSNRKPTVADACSTNTYAAWENKIYIVLCGGVPGIKIVTRSELFLSIGLTVATEDFYDENFLMRTSPPSSESVCIASRLWAGRWAVDDA